MFRLWSLLASYISFVAYVWGSSCDVNFSVYVYDLPASLIANQEAARRNQTYHICKKCIYEQFALEYIVYDYFTQFCGRTYNPDAADFFYLPIIKDLDYRIALSNGGRNSRQPSASESALLAALERNDTNLWRRVFNVTDKYWLRRGGMDHILVMAAPVTNLRHESSRRGYFHYMMQLHTPIFLSVEVSESFTLEYPICTKQKNIVMPYPTTDPDFYSGRLFAAQYPHLHRSKLLFYLGGNHGSCVQVRQALTSLTRFKKIAIQRGTRKREEGFQSAIFCPIPVGDSPSSKRMYDVLNFGCIPVVLSEELVWAFSQQTGGDLHPSSFSIKLPQSIVQWSARHLLQYKVKSDKDLNYGKKLPTGTSIFQLLQQVAREEQRDDDTAQNKFRVGMERMPNASISDNYQLQTRNAAPVSTNALVRLLQLIPEVDILELQQSVRNTSYYYHMYSMKTKDVKNLRQDPNQQSDPIPTAVHQYPDGGALQLLQLSLSRRKAIGVTEIGAACQRERYAPGHQYIGSFPCDRKDGPS